MREKGREGVDGWSEGREEGSDEGEEANFATTYLL